MTTITNIQPKPYTQFGVKHERTNGDGEYNAEVIKGESIRVYGYSYKWVYDKTAHCTTKMTVNFDRTFKIGDTVEIGSCNLVYTGEIEAISDKRVTYRQYKNDEHRQTMDLYNFIRRNWDLDLEQISARNSDTMQYI